MDVDFRYWTNGRQLPLPEWAGFFLDVGTAVAKLNCGNQRLVTAIAVPTRSYAALLIAAGLILSKAKSAHSDYERAPLDHFESLCTLPTGTSVILQNGNRAVKGILVGARTEQSDGGKRIGVQIQSGKGGGLTNWLPPKLSHKIQVSSTNWGKLPVDSEKSRDARVSRSEFVSQVLQGEDLKNFVGQSVLDCLVIGGVSLLKKEATLTKLSVGSTSSEASAGALQDLLRVRSLFNNGEPYRSDFIPARMSEYSRLPDDLTPDAAIFDDAGAFIRWRHNWSRCHWVVILDRTDPRFREAVQVVNEEYLSRFGDSELSLPEPPPLSVELVAFTVAG